MRSRPSFASSRYHWPTAAGSSRPGLRHCSGATRPPEPIPASGVVSPVARLETILNALDDGYCLVEVLFDRSAVPIDYRFLECNPAFEAQTGLHDAVGRMMRELAPQHEEHWFQIYGRVALTGQSERFEQHAAALDDRWYDVFAVRVDDPAERHVAILFRDITPRKRAQDALRENAVRLREAAEQLQQADQRKDEFLATLAHELRNPLAPIRNGVQILRLASVGDTNIQRIAEIMDRQVSHLVRLVDDLLDVSRITRGQVGLRQELVTVNRVLSRAVESCSTLFEPAGLHLRVEIPPDPVCVEGDADRLIQVFSNLLANAAKFTPREGTVSLSLSAGDGHAIVVVEDNGIGIPTDRLKDVFEMFAQVHAPGGNSGLGIGLALVRQIVLLHHGSVVAESEGPGHGSRFTVRLPLQQQEPHVDRTG